MGFEALRLDRLPELRAARAGQFSSYDRTGGNDDRGHYLAAKGATAVLAEVKGPGCIYRIWSANPAGQLRLYFDGEEEPRVEVPFRELLAGQLQPFAPFCSDVGGGGCCYYPLPFRKSCRVTVENAPPLYYQITYHTFPPGTEVETFRGESSQKRLEVGKRREPEQTGPSLRLTAGQTATLFEHRQAGRIVALTLQVHPLALAVLRGLILRMYWDGEARPSVECPVADFFAAGLGPSEEMGDPRLPVSHGAGLTCRFPMPYLRSARLTLTNRTSQAVTVKPQWTLADGGRTSGPVGRFHAQYREAPTVAGKPYVILEARGRGHYIGTSVVLWGREDLRFLEGDERIFVDGEAQPSLQGTGTEDYFNGGWYFLRGPFATPWAGAPVLQAGKSRIAAYRWQVSDAVPFHRSIRVELEHGPHNDAPGCTYRSVAFWYQTEPHAPSPPLPSIQPWPPFREPGVIEGEELQGQGKEVRSDAALPQQASGGRFVRFLVPTERGPLRLQVPVASSGAFDVQARVIAGPWGGEWAWEWGAESENETWKIERRNPRRFSTWGAGVAVKEVNLGRVRLKAGVQPVTLFPQGLSPGALHLDLDYLRLQPVSQVKGALEGEDLKVLEASPGVQVAIDDWTTSPEIPRQWSPQVTGGRRYGPADWSGGAQVKIVAPPQGGQVTFALPVAEGKEYAVGVSLTKAPGGGKVRFRLDGRPLGPAIETSSGDGEPVWQVDYRVGLGAVALRLGSHRLTVEVAPSPKGAGMGLDYLWLRPVLGRLEAEDLPVLEATAPVLIHERFGTEPRWSSGAFLRFQARQVGDRLTLAAPLFRRGRYRLKLGLAGRPAGGQSRVFWDGKPVGGTVNGFRPVDSPAVLQVGLVRGRAGLHRLTLESVGRNGPSAGYEIGLDYLELEAVTASPAWRRGVAAGMAGLVLAGVVLGARWIQRRRGLPGKAGSGKIGR